MAVFRHGVEMGKKCDRDWGGYTASLKRQGRLTILIDPALLNCWSGDPKRRRPGGVRRYCDRVIEMCLLVRERFQLALRQTEGFIESIFRLVGVDRPVPDYTTLSRRAKGLHVELASLSRHLAPGAVLAVDSTGLTVYRQDGWQRIKHGRNKGQAGKLEQWRKLHVCIDTATGLICEAIYSEANRNDGLFMADLLAPVQGRGVAAVCADAAYDTTRCRRAVHELGATQRIPPIRPARTTHERRETLDPPDRAALAERDAAIERIRETDRKTWKKESGYNRRSLVETAMWRIKQASNARLSNRTEPNRKAQARIKCKLANMLLAA